MRRLLFAVAAAVALWSAACSSGSGSQTPPPPQGMYTLASLNGTYAFVTNGTLFNGSEFSFARTGSFAANGQGGITGGVYDTNTQGVVPTQPNVITGGSYTVNADGRGTLTLNINASGTASTVNFAIVLTSTSDGLMIDETGALSNQNSSQVSTGSGNFVKQTISDFNVATISGPYVFDFSGFDGTQAPESIVGEFTGSGGALTGGFEDVNDNFGLSNGAISPGSFTADATYMSTNGRGLATIAGETYAFYIVDATRVRLISNSSSGNMLNGDAVAQDSTVPTAVSGISGGFAFLVAGSVGNGGITRVGRFTSTGGALSQLHVDSNTAGQYNLTDVTASAGNITLDPANLGRGTITFTQGGNTGFTAVFYLSSATSGVLQETDQVTIGGVQTAVAVADGTILAQSGSPSSSSVTGPYAYNWSGQTLQNNNVLDEEDCLGQATITSLNLSGAADLFEFQVALATDQNAKGPINFNGGDGTTDDGKRPTMQLTIGGNPAISFVLYFVNPQLAFFSNNTAPMQRISAGLIKLQQ
jgi:hypothetical protein